MSYLTIRLPDDQIKRLKQLATERHVSMSVLFEQISAQVLSEVRADEAPSDIGCTAGASVTGSVKALGVSHR